MALDRSVLRRSRLPRVHGVPRPAGEQAASRHRAREGEPEHVDGRLARPSWKAPGTCPDAEPRRHRHRSGSVRPARSRSASVLLAILGLLVGPVFAVVGLVAPAVVARMVVKSKARTAPRGVRRAASRCPAAADHVAALRSQPAAGVRRGGHRGGGTGSRRVRPHVGRDPHRGGVPHGDAGDRPADGLGRPRVDRFSGGDQPGGRWQPGRGALERARHRARAVPAAPTDQDAHCRRPDVGQGSDRVADPDLRHPHLVRRQVPRRDVPRRRARYCWPMAPSR